MASLKDVARESGVSIKTVSNVINNFQYVSSKTKKKVLDAVKELGYIPNKSARELVLGRPSNPSLKFHTGKNIACVLPSDMGKYHDSYFSCIFKGVEQEIRKSGHFLFFAEPYEELEKNPILMNGLLNSDNLDGIISFIGPDKEIVFDHLKKVAPIVSVGKVDGIASITIDKQSGIKLALEHLRNLGHKKIAFIGGTRKNDGYYDERYSSFLTEISRLKLISSPSWQIGEGFGYEIGYEAAMTLLQNKELPSAVVCASDITAIGVINAFYDSGRKIPHDISITGFDNIQESELIFPKLTTIDVDKTKLGALAVHTLLELIEYPDTPPSIKTIPVKLIERGSTKNQMHNGGKGNE